MISLSISFIIIPIFFFFSFEYINTLLLASLFQSVCSLLICNKSSFLVLNIPLLLIISRIITSMLDHLDTEAVLASELFTSTALYLLLGQVPALCDFGLK